MAVGDGLIYSSSREKFGEDTPCQQFTAIGDVTGSELYKFEMFPGFVPYCREIHFFDAKNIAIRPLIGQISFIKDKIHWGYAFRYGHLEIPRADFELSVAEMMK